MYKPIIITCQPDDNYYIWQNQLYIDSCLEAGFEEEQIHILLYKPYNRIYNTKWEKLKIVYPKINLYVYEDKGVQQFINIYQPIIRPHILSQHFEKFPELQNKTIIYTDCDILWVGKLDIEKYFDDDKNYISNASSYLNYDYFLRKENDVLPEKKEEFLKKDIIKELCNIVGISVETFKNNNNNTGGVQYILKNINADFWKKIEIDTLTIRLYLMNINKQYFKDEDSGYQSWCSDLWAVLFNLWNRNTETFIISEMDFAWSTEPIEVLKTKTIFHNAGITGENTHPYPTFYKGKYHKGECPFNDEILQLTYNNEETKKYCNHYYLTKLLNLKNKIIWH